jgi:hypothetical protein
VATDGAWVYFACSSSVAPGGSNQYQGCIVAFNASNYGSVSFTNGIIITNAVNPPFPGIYAGTQPGLSGLSVQQNSNLMAVAVATDNTVYLFDKRSGAALSSFSVPNPQRLNFSTDGTLWVVSVTNVLCYTNVNSSPSLALAISGLSQPLDVAVCPTNSDLILVADGGGSQQVKAFNSAGTPLWTYGLLGGYQSNGVAVATNKFWFSYEGVAQTFLCFAPDGSFWVGDEENHRAMHFSLAQTYIEQIMYQPYSYRVSVDQNNLSRVFNQFLEFSVNYTNPLPQSWTLVNNWKVGVPTNNISVYEGLYQVTTFTNGRTYAIIDNSTPAQTYELCELTNSQLRLTGILPLYSTTNSWISLGADGSARRIPLGSPLFYSAPLTGFDTNNNPLWNTNSPTLLATATSGSTDPIPRCCSGPYEAVAISSNNVVISYDGTLNNGYHFGGIQLGGTNWLWRTGPSYNMNGQGNFEISNGVAYPGDMAWASGRNVYFGYHGEFFRGQGQASQGLHFYDDGLFVGQFGESSLGHSAYEGPIPGFSGNDVSPDLITTSTGDTYLWLNDESAHGPERWHFVNTRNIREQIGSGTSGSTIILTNQAYGFPTAVAGQNGHQSGFLSWPPVAGATSYNVYYSLMNGGPYNVLAGNTTGSHYFASGLTNGQTYFFAVTAIVAGAEGTPSEQVEISPFDMTQTVLTAGSLAEGIINVPIMDVSSSAVSSNQPSFIGAERPAGVLTPYDLSYYGYGSLMNKTIGTQGYVIYDWGGPGINLTNLSSLFSVTNAGGWADISFLGRQYKVDGVLGTNVGLSANPVGMINIGVNDSNFHFLTVVSPQQFANSRLFTLGLTSTNGTSAQYSANETHGYTHTFQFLFKGNVTLQANATGGSAAIVQAIFLDNASFYSLQPATELHVATNVP